MPQDEPQDTRSQNEMLQNEYRHISIENAEEEVFVVGARRVTNDPTFCQQPSQESHVTSKRASEDASKDASEDAYEQTSDDLQAEPMSLLQKIIIAAAVAGVIILVAYLIFSFQA